MSKKNEKKLTKRQIRKKRRKKILIVEAVVLVVLIVVLAVWAKLGMINWEDLKNLAGNKLDDKTEKMLEGYTNIALFGVDNRSNGNYDSGNSDSIMIASINNKTKEVKLVSVYRDTLLDVGDDSYRKCNYAYNHGGAEAAINMLNTNLDLDIENYVAVDFYALVEAVDALGGVEIDVTAQEAQVMNASYIDPTSQITGIKSSHVSPGLQTLDGVQAVSYCRIRYTAGDDFKRTERQRTVLTKLAEKANDANLLQLNSLINAVFDDVSTSLKLSQIISLASAMRNYTLVDTTGFPFAKCTGTYGKRGSLVVPCTLESNVSQLHAYLFGTEDYKPTKEVRNRSAEVINITGKREGDAVE